jgi:hypothetical protein
MPGFGEYIILLPIDDFQCGVVFVGSDGHIDKGSIRFGIAFENVKEWSMAVQGTADFRQLRSMGGLEIDKIGFAPIVAFIFEQRHGADYSPIQCGRQMRSLTHTEIAENTLIDLFHNLYFPGKDDSRE